MKKFQVLLSKLNSLETFFEETKQTMMKDLIDFSNR